MSADIATPAPIRPMKAIKCVRTGTTKNGNPLYVLHTDVGLFKSRPDTAQAFAVENTFPVGETLDLDILLRTDEDGNFWDWAVLPRE